MIFLLDWLIEKEDIVETVAATTNATVIVDALEKLRKEFPDRDYCIRVFDSKTGQYYTTLSREEEESEPNFWIRFGEFLAKART